MRKIKAIAFIFDDGAVLYEWDNDEEEETPEPSPTVAKRRRSKRTCPHCRQKFFAMGIGSHMKACVGQEAEE